MSSLASLRSLYGFKFAGALVYMLQNSEYQIWPYLRWFWRVRDFSGVMYRRTLDRTLPARVLLAILRAGMILQVLAGAGLIIGWLVYGWVIYEWPLWQLGLTLIVSYPIVWAHLVTIPLALARALIIVPREQRAVARSERIFAAHPGMKLAIAGSYGKTSMKELLMTVLSSARVENSSAASLENDSPARVENDAPQEHEDKRVSLRVAATPANKNVALSHAQFATTLNGTEDIILIEYGEGQPGDVARYAQYTHPTHAVITGITPAHLDQYKTLAAAATDIFSVTKVVPPGHSYANADSPEATAYMAAREETDTVQTYDSHKVLGWRISGIKLSVESTKFQMKKGKRQLRLTSHLLGRHQVGPLAFTAAFGMELGMTAEQAAQGVAAALPFEHRMQPYRLNGACIIDDTYNGNLEGIRAGTALLGDLPAERKWYVTPGLVDQGQDTAQIHHQVGELIAAAKPDTVVLINNSVTGYIKAGLKAGDYKGELRIETDPLNFYTNLSYFVAAGDLVMMQNDWTDNYE